uniref:hypothetical protein n=1 Tax=Eisenbergiella tayi TaxID=1432052 RepID=UPI003FEE7219
HRFTVNMDSLQKINNKQSDFVKKAGFPGKTPVKQYLCILCYNYTLFCRRYCVFIYFQLHYAYSDKAVQSQALSKASGI